MNKQEQIQSLCKSIRHYTNLIAKCEDNKFIQDMVWAMERSIQTLKVITQGEKSC